MKTLAIDAGNTRVKWGIHNGHGWFLRGAIETTRIGAKDAFAHVHKENVFDHIMVSNVAGAAVGNAIKDALYDYAAPIRFIVSQAAQCGVTSRYEDATQLGTDRWAALIAAHTAMLAAPRAQLVVMAGTALTVDALTEQGEFLGGIIVPGLALMRQALYRGTAQLPALSGAYQTFPRNSINAIASGAVEACAGAVQRMHTHLSARLGAAPQCIGSGGAMEVLSHHLPFPVSINENLVLDGLCEIARAGT